MSRLAELLARSLEREGAPSRAATILEWALSALEADGIALLVSSPTPGAGWEARLALGYLTTTAPLLAADLSRTGVAAEPAILPLTESRDSFLCCPVNVDRGTPWSALVFQGASIGETAAAHRADVAEVIAALREVLEEERQAVEAPSGGGAVPVPSPAEKPDAPAVPHPGPVAVSPLELVLESLRSAGHTMSGLLPSLSVLTEGLRLPLYLCSAQGEFTFASPGFLALTGYPSLEALKGSRDFFQEPEQRWGELAAVRRHGKVESFPLAVRSGTGVRLQIRDSAVSVGESVLGVFFDVTRLVAANAELKDALQIQELLNDSILAGANQLQRTQGAAIRALARLAEYRDPETGFHLQRICEFSRLLAVEVHLRAPYTFRITMDYANDISLSSMLHDVGKVSIPDHILLKPGRLEPDEWEVMKKHTMFGWEVLHKADRELGEQSFLTLAASIALSHHERFDGAGYPHGTAGEQIPLSARIAAVADVYDALTSTRPYKQAWSHERAVQEIVNQSGGHFDPVLVGIFSDLAPQFADVRQRFPG
ncbi:MAG TPA: HD domain-containing phosphohydrolase [Spirochaetia bacterium]|nr:HD domain-containing phosphohydrolase [Spirochaetia bacterium]